jgi:hypothetical protein
MSVNLKKYIFLFSLILIFTSFDIWSYGRGEFIGNGYELLAYKIFMRPLAGGFLSIIELFFLFILIKIVRSDRERSANWSWQEKYIFWGAVICFVFRMANPNNDPGNPIFGLPLISDPTYYTFLILLFVFFSMKSWKFTKYIKYFLFAIIVASIIRGVILMLFWMAGHGQNFFGVFNSTLIESDSLYFYAFIQVFSLGLYLLYSKNKYLFLFLFCLFIEILSFRRSALFTALIGNFLTVFIFLFEKRKGKFKLSIFLFAALAFTLLLNIQSLPLSPGTKFLFLRFANALPGTDSGTGVLSDSGHWQQTEDVTQSALTDLSFWGSGYGKTFFVKGQSAGTVHNFYIAIWAKYGIFMLVYYLGIVLITLFKFIQILFSKVHNEYERIARFYKIILCTFLIGYFIAMTTNTIYDVETFKMRFLWVLILAAILKVTPESVRMNLETSRQNSRT